MAADRVLTEAAGLNKGIESNPNAKTQVRKLTSNGRKALKSRKWWLEEHLQSPPGLLRYASELKQRRTRRWRSRVCSSGPVAMPSS